MSTFDWAGILIAVLVFVSRDFERGRTCLAGGVDRQTRMGLIFVIFTFYFTGPLCLVTLG